MLRRLLTLASVLVVLMAIASPITAQEGPSIEDRSADRVLPVAIEGTKLGTPLSSSIDVGVLDASLLGASGQTEVIVRLKSPSVAEEDIDGAAAEDRKEEIADEQEELVERILDADAGAEVLADVQVVLNAVFVEVDAEALEEIAADPAVERIAPVGDYELDLSETVPYIGAAAAQNAGFDGSGVRIAVLDSGIDYTHANLGGEGTLAAYEAAYADNTALDGLFPTAKVVAGYDFVGEGWFSSDPADGSPPLAPDPDPIDFEGHGTHVADISAGLGGVAPGAELVAVKVCSAVGSSCSGIALIQGMNFATDPNGDGDPSDAVDIINMSLGSPYGQPFDDDLSAAVDQATALGILTVASAGNSADKPYITGSPAAAETALSVAQTQVPSATLQLIDVDGVDYPAEFQPWSVPLAGTIAAPVQYGDGAGGNLNGCAPFAADSLTGLVVLVDRGACSFSLKISNISQGGGEAGIIGLVAPGAPFAGGDGGDRPIDIPGWMISQADSTAIKAAIGNPGLATISDTNQLPLVGQLVGSSSRGPQADDNRIKPEIGAPGASVSAIAGTGSETGPFGGTSGAAPMVTGSAALLLQAQPNLTALELKAKLMNTGETDIATDPFSGLAPITRIGGGEVRVDRAIEANAAAWDRNEPSGSLSFGFVDVHQSKKTLRKRVVVHNYSDQAITYNISNEFRFDDDVANGAVQLRTPSRIRVPAGGERTFTVRLTIDGNKLRGNAMNSGSDGANPAGLTLNEYDGYINLVGDGQTIHVPWQVLPRQAARVAGSQWMNFRQNGVTADVKLRNRGVGVAQNDAYSLIATSPNIPEGTRGSGTPVPDIRAVGVNTIPVPAGFCSADESFLWTFAINTWERQTHLLPVSHQITLDTNRDGTDDYLILNRDASLTGASDGRQFSWVVDLATGSAGAFFFAEHATNTGNTVLTVCAEQVGLSPADYLLTNVDISVFAQDFYFGGPGDLIDDLTITPLGEQYVATVDDIAPRKKGTMEVTNFGPQLGNTPELGIMLITNGDRGEGAHGGATRTTEMKLFYPKS